MGFTGSLSHIWEPAKEETESFLSYYSGDSSGYRTFRPVKWTFRPVNKIVKVKALLSKYILNISWKHGF